jgi:hypothetical protein
MIWIFVILMGICVWNGLTQPDPNKSRSSLGWGLGFGAMAMIFYVSSCGASQNAGYRRSGYYDNRYDSIINQQNWQNRQSGSIYDSNQRIQERRALTDISQQTSKYAPDGHY